MKTFALPPNYDWKRLGYTLYGSSTDYRKVILDNPQWDMDHLPAIGSTLLFQGPKQTGVHNSGITPLVRTSPAPRPNVFPFSSEEEYQKALSNYVPDNLLSVEANNGWTLDSIQALTGLQ